mgnify:CR=1 FL=1
MFQITSTRLICYFRTSELLQLGNLVAHIPCFSIIYMLLASFGFFEQNALREFLMRQYSKLTVVNVLILDFSFKELTKSI